MRAALTLQHALLAGRTPCYGLMLCAALIGGLRADEPPPNPLRAHKPNTGNVTDDPAQRTLRGGISVSVTDDPFGDGLLEQVTAQEMRPAEVVGPPVAGESFVQPHLEPPLSGPHLASPPLDPAYVHANPAFPGGSWLADRLASWIHEPWFAHSDPNDPFRHVGLGQPLVGTSWRNRPIYAGAFVGGVLMDDFTSNIYQNNTSFLGLRLGYDFDHYWGLEGRWAFARPELETRAGEPLDFSRDYFADVSLLHYPFGDASWRPYVLAGLGFQTYRFGDETGQRIAESALSLPLGFGLKYYCSPWFTLRFDFVDNIAFGNARVKAMQNVSLMVGAEFRFGGSRPSYYPWHASTSYW